MKIDIGTVVKFVIGIIAFLSGVFGWIIVVIRRQNRLAILTIKDDAEIKEKIKAHDKDIEHIKILQEKTANKIDDITGEIGILRATILETGLITRSLKENIKKLDNDIAQINNKIDLIITNLNKKEK